MAMQWTPRPIDGVPDGIVLFDGVCVLCSWWVRFVIDRDAAALFRFVPIQSRYGRTLAARLHIDVADPPTNAVVVGGQAWFKSDAGLRVLERLPCWSWTAAFRVLPRRTRDWIYDRVAQNRYRLFGRTDTCIATTTDMAARFVFDPPRTEAQ